MLYASLLMLLVASGAPPRGPAVQPASPIAVEAGSRLLGGFVRQAAADLAEALEEQPNAPLLLPLFGLACSRYGDYACAVIATEGELLEGPGMVGAPTARATALRAVGRGHDAAALRAEALLLADGSAGQDAIVWAAISEDLRFAGDLEGAREAAEAALAAAPSLPHPYVAFANLALDRGDLDEAAFQLFLAERQQVAPRGLLHLRARMILETEPEHSAFAVLLARVKEVRGSRTDPVISATMAEIRRRQGDLDAADGMLDRRSIETLDQVWHPALLAELARVRADQGRLAEARDLLDRATATYPSHPWVQAAAAALAPTLAPSGEQRTVPPR